MGFTDCHLRRLNENLQDFTLISGSSHGLPKFLSKGMLEPSPTRSLNLIGCILPNSMFIEGALVAQIWHREYLFHGNM